MIWAFEPRTAERRGLRLGLSLAALVVAVALVFRDEVLGPYLVPLRGLTAQTTLALIRLAGMDAVREASALYHSGGFAYEISRGCMGLVPVAFFVVALLAYGGRTQRGLVALAVGVPALLGLNLIRLTHLFYLGVYRPEWFHLSHEVLWQGAMVLAVLALWLASVAWVDSRRPEVTELRAAGRPARRGTGPLPARPA